MRDQRVILVGATGMVGGIALSLCLESASVSEVTVIGRRPLGSAHPKLKEVVHSDFRDFTTVTEHFDNQDLARPMVRVGLNGAGDTAATILENRDIRNIVRALPGIAEER